MILSTNCTPAEHDFGGGVCRLLKNFKLGFVGLLVKTEQPPCGTLGVGEGLAPPANERLLSINRL